MFGDYFICHCARTVLTTHTMITVTPSFQQNPSTSLSLSLTILYCYGSIFSSLNSPPPPPTISYNSFIDRLFSTTIVETLKQPNLYCNSFVCINRMKSLVSSEDILASLLHCLRNTTFKADCSFLLFCKYYSNCFALNNHI